jgi:hypothetical protein
MKLEREMHHLTTNALSHAPLHASPGRSYMVYRSSPKPPRKFNPYRNVVCVLRLPTSARQVAAFEIPVIETECDVEEMYQLIEQGDNLRIRYDCFNRHLSCVAQNSRPEH